MNVVGFNEKSFSFEDGKQVNGFYLYLTEPRSGVTGVAVERVFCSSRKLDGYIPSVGDEVQIYYNRFGKVDRILLVNSID